MEPGFLAGGGLITQDNALGVTLRANLASLSPGGTLTLTDGIYQMGTPLSIGAAGATVKAANGARPIITGSDELPPAVNIIDGTTIQGLWFGGRRPTSATGSNTITVGSNCLVEDCTLFGYINGIQEGDGLSDTYRRIRFVRCGLDPSWHPIYISTENTDPAKGSLVELCLFVGCFGYSIHLYHEPGYSVARDNFIGDASNGLAIQGDVGGPVNGDHNIVWNVSANPLFNSLTTGSCDHNVWRGCSQPGINGGGSFDGNYFVSPVPTAGTNPTVWQESDVLANFGQASAAIDAAISALEASFGADITTVHADSTIEANFALLAGVVAEWEP